VNIGIVGSGNMGASMGKIWAAKSHKVLFSFSTDQEKLRAVAAAAGAAVPEALRRLRIARARPCSVASTA
jgi:predicted dinucleotide-binding enzyme